MTDKYSAICDIATLLSRSFYFFYFVHSAHIVIRSRVKEIRRCERDIFNALIGMYTQSEILDYRALIHCTSAMCNVCCAYCWSIFFFMDLQQFLGGNWFTLIGIFTCLNLLQLCHLKKIFIVTVLGHFFLNFVMRGLNKTTYSSCPIESTKKLVKSPI